MPVFKNEIIPINAKIGAVTHADVLEHTVTLESLGLPANTKLLFLDFSRTAGTGFISVYPNNGANAVKFSNPKGQDHHWTSVDGGILTYKLSVANDAWYIYCYGYMTQRSRGVTK